MRPIDTDEIERNIEQLERERDDVDEELSELEDLSSRLPGLEERQNELGEEIAGMKSSLADKREELAEADKSVEESRAENEELDEKMTQLQEARKEIKRVRRDVESEQESIDALQEDLSDQRAAFDGLSPVADERIADLEEEMQHKRGQVEAINQTINELQSVIQFNDDFLEDGQPEIVEQVQSDGQASSGTVTDKLLEDGESTTCWTCGSEVATEQIESNLKSLRSLRKQKMEDRQSLKRAIQEHKSEKDELETQQQRYQELRRSIDRTEDEIADREENLESLAERREELSGEIEALESTVKELQKEDHSDVLEVQEAVNRLEFELEDLQSELADVEDEVDAIEGKLSEREDLEARYEEIQDELADLRTRVEQLQEQAIDEFNEHMDAVLGLLDYDNLERIWIERTQERVREGRRKVEQQRFDLHVVRSTDSGTVYEDTVNHLSESEREVTGLVFALAGYLVHEVYETVPFMLLDSIEAIDSDRIANLVDYLEGYADYLVVALLEEDSAALNDGYPRITSI
jgi:chromosome segregation ATPase